MTPIHVLRTCIGRPGVSQPARMYRNWDEFAKTFPSIRRNDHWTAVAISELDEPEIIGSVTLFDNMAKLLAYRETLILRGTGTVSTVDRAGSLPVLVWRKDLALVPDYNVHMH